MKTKNFGKPLSQLITMVAICILSLNAMAYDFSYTYQGKTLYYDITSSNTVEVTYYSYSYNNNYVSGDVIIPSSVTNNGTTYSVTSIRYYAFSGCSSLTSITIPNSVTTIGNSAFYYCSSLTSVTIPNSVTTIGNSAFYYCSSLTSVTIPNSVTSIAEYAFSRCSSLTSITIPESVTSIGSAAFWDCSSLASITIPNSVTSIGDYAFDECSGLTSVTIPNSVTSIGEDAFSGCSSLTSITIPNSVTSIGYEAFSSCSSLTSVTIGNSVTEIGSSAFSNCSSLTSVIIGNSVTSIGGSAFYGCNSLTSVTIPNSVTSIGDNAFRDCSRITCLASNPPTLGSNVFSASAIITIPMTNFASYASSDWNNYNINFEHYGLSYHFTENNTVAVYSFDATITSAIIPSSIQYGSTTYSVTSIGNSAFSGCNSLTSVTIPESVTSIGNYAFYNCSSLTTLNFNAVNCSDFASGNGHQFYSCPITTINIGNSVQRIPANFARGLSSLTSVTIPNSVTSIGNRAFYYCSSLTTLNFNAVNCSDFASGNGQQFYSCPISTINIGDSVQRIPAYFAYNLDSLTFVTIPNSVTSIGNSAFCSCSNLTSVNIPESVTSIKDSTFLGCSSLTSVTIPNSVTYIGNGAFSRCSSLTSVNIPNSITYIGNGAFSRCSSLTSVTIPESVTSIGYEAFCGCSSLNTLNFNAINCNNFTSGNGHQFYSSPITTINIGDSVQRIPANFANGKSGLISISIPNSVTEIGDSAFMNCSGLIAVTIGNGVNNIYSNSFRGCTNLTYLTIGSSVETIEDLAFIDCNMLSHITSKATTPPEIASSNVFPYPNECSLTVPCGSLGAYTDQMNRWYLLFNPRIDEDIVFAFSVSANDDAFGIVSNEALSCSVRKITAIPFDGYEFVSWNDGNTSNPRTINITSDTSFVAVFATIGSSALQEVESTREFVVYPNPARGFVTIEFEALQECCLLRIIDLGGRVVKTFDIAAGTETLRLDLRDLPSGVYTLMIGNTTKKLIIE